MSLAKLNIPPRIRVGYQTRRDTYTGKLAYVIYYDEKGKLRKERSWQSWRDGGIKPDTFDNEPTEGFVLNKKVGGYGGWNPRNTWVRVYDPRDFEFEISVPNLLFILAECSSIKGKGLEGQFVYAWDKTELVLLPVGSQEYKASSEYTSLQSMKVTKNDMVAGCWYKTKQGEAVMYLGREDFYTLHRSYLSGYSETCYQTKSKKLHVFVDQDGKYWTQTGFTKLALRTSTEPDPEFANAYDAFKKSVNGSPCSKVSLVPLPPAKDATYAYYRSKYAKKGDNHWVKYSRGWHDSYEVDQIMLKDGQLVVRRGGRRTKGPIDASAKDCELYLENAHRKKLKIW